MMLSRGRLIFFFCSLTTVFLVVGSTMVAAANRQQEDDSSDSAYKYLAVFMEVFGLVNRAYVDEPELPGLMSGAFEGTVDALDPFSLYVPMASVASFERSSEIGTRRSGMLVLKERGVAYIVAVEDGSPADQAGLEGGDILSQIGADRTRQTPLFAIREVLTAEPGTRLEVERIRQGQTEQVTLELGSFDRPAVVLEQREGVATLRIPDFHAGTLTNLNASLETISRGAEGLAGLKDNERLLIDLRGVAGGDEAVAYEAAGLFAKGALGALHRRQEELQVFASTTEPSWQGKFVVLINRGTQGAAEIFAAILQQNLDAILVGENSFGHSGRLGSLELSDGGRLFLTDAFFSGPDRKPIESSLEPDVRIRASFQEPDEEPVDEVLDRGIEILLDDEPVEEKKAA